MCIVAGNVHRANIQGEMMDEIILEQVTTEELLRLLQKRVKDVEENTYGQWYTWRDSWLQGKLILHLYEHVGLLQTEEERSRGGNGNTFQRICGYGGEIRAERDRDRRGMEGVCCPARILGGI